MHLSIKALGPILFLALVISACGSQAPEASPELSAWDGDATVQTLSGPVEAQEGEALTWVWKAIPYAKPPVESLRWREPEAPDPWSTTRQETEFCEVCPQYDLLGSVIGSEDCLYLNIWRPQSDEVDLPVYFWIHGGGNSMGSASDPGYDGANLASTSNMVVVTVNYRLGPLGWLSHSSLRSGQPGDELSDSGNYGTLDLIKALTWAQRNIESFGGDPDNVTIAGESAGAINVFSLLISPEADDLFHRAIAQSGMPVTSSPEEGEESARSVVLGLMVNDGTATDLADAEARLDGMSDAEIESYLRAKTPAEILEVYESLAFHMISFPFIFEDGTVIPEEGFGTLETGAYPGKVPVMVGSNKEETKLFLFTNRGLTSDEETYQAVASYTSDLWKAVGVDEVARDLTSNDDQPGVYVYQFLWGAGGDTGESVIPDPWGFRLGACHGLDVPFFFGNYDFFGPLSWLLFTEENRPGRDDLSSAMMAYAAQFARTGDPNAPGSELTEWNAWSNDPDQPKCMLLDSDREAARLSMSALELTVSGVRSTVDLEILDELEGSLLEELERFLELDAGGLESGSSAP